MYTLTLHGKEVIVGTIDVLRTHLAQIKGGGLWEVWLSPEGEESSLTALINNEAAWLMYLPDKEGTSFSTRNPAYTGSPKAVIAYTLYNGQIDEYPAAWNITTKAALQAFEYYFTNAVGMTPELTWNKDS